MYPSSNNRGRRPSTRWLLVPIIAVAGIIAIVVGAGLYLAATHAYPVGSYYYLFPFPFFPLIFIPVAILAFFGLRWWFFWGCWGRGWNYYYGQYDPAMVALRERYAKGEITKDQLDQMARDLGEQAQMSPQR